MLNQSTAMTAIPQCAHTRAMTATKRWSRRRNACAHNLQGCRIESDTNLYLEAALSNFCMQLLRPMQALRLILHKSLLISTL